MDSGPNSISTYRYPLLQSPPAKQPHSVEQEIQNTRPLLPDEVQLWNNCLRVGFWKCGVPFAILSHFLTRRFSKKVIQTPPNPTAALPAKALMFGFNCFVGFLFYTPFCFKKLKVKFLENEEKLKQMNELNVQMKKADNLENVSPHLQSSFDTESSFSHLNMDFDSSMVENLSFEDSNVNKQEKISRPHTTYEELRKQNRESYNRGVIYSAYTPEKSEGQKSTKNKYGDEME